MSEEQTSVDQTEMFYIYEVGDESKFPVLGFENADVRGVPYIRPENMNMFAVSVLEVLARSCPNRNFTIEWDKIEVYT